MENSIERKEGSACYRCLLKGLGATILGVKPAELKNFSSQQRNYRAWKNYKQLLLFAQFKAVKIKESDQRTKILFYHRSALDNWLANQQRLKILQELGYPKEYSLPSYLDFLVAKLRRYETDDAQFPHELGIFLGYPLKDVLGFMDYVNLEFTEQSEWKIYGNRAVSLAREKEFSAARAAFAELVDELYK